MTVYRLWAAANALCCLSITSRNMKKKQVFVLEMDGDVWRSTITALCIGENGVSSVKWSDYEKLTVFFFSSKTSQKTDTASSNLSLFMWCVSARRERSGGALIDLSEAIRTSSEQKIGRRRLTVSSVRGITWHQQAWHRPPPVSAGEITTSQVRSEMVTFRFNCCSEFITKLSFEPNGSSPTPQTTSFLGPESCVSSCWVSSGGCTVWAACYSWNRLLNVRSQQISVRFMLEKNESQNRIQ